MTALDARSQANKTYYAARTDLQQRGRAWAQSDPTAQRASATSKWGVDADIGLFATGSTNEYGMGKYFGAAMQPDLSDAKGTVQIVPDNDRAYLKTNALFGRQIDNSFAPLPGGGAPRAPMSGTLTLRPSQNRFGAVIAVGGDLGRVAPKLAGVRLSLEAPIVCVSTNHGATESDVVAASYNGTSTPLSYFTGAYATAVTGDTQAALTKNKLSLKSISKTAIADLRFSAEYAITQEVDAGLSVHGSVIIPTGNRSTAEYMFEPVAGNNGHVGLGIGTKGHSLLWEKADKTMSLWFSGAVEYTYLFQAREKRVVGLWEGQRDPAFSHTFVAIDKIAPWRHMVLGKKDLGGAGAFPMANVLAQDLYVAPGTHFESILGLTLKWKQFHVNLGYDVFYRQQESLSLVEAWPNDTYVEAAGKTLDGTVLNEYFIQAPGKVTENSTLFLYPQAAATPDQETQMLLLSGGYVGKVKSYPVTASLGASYELATNNSKALQGWGLFGKVALAF